MLCSGEVCVFCEEIGGTGVRVVRSGLCWLVMATVVDCVLRTSWQSFDRTMGDFSFCLRIFAELNFGLYTYFS